MSTSQLISVLTFNSPMSAIDISKILVVSAEQFTGLIQLDYDVVRVRGVKYTRYQFIPKENMPELSVRVLLVESELPSDYSLLRTTDEERYFSNMGMFRAMCLISDPVDRKLQLYPRGTTRTSKQLYMSDLENWHTRLIVTMIAEAEKLGFQIRSMN